MWTAQVYKGGGCDARISESKPHKMGLQVPYRVDTEIQEEEIVRDNQETVGAGHQGACPPEGIWDCRGAMVGDHVHMAISIPPKYAVAQVIGYIKGKSAIWVARTCGHKRNFIGQNFWARGYCVSTIGLDDETVCDYVRKQEEEDKKLDQLKMFEEKCHPLSLDS